MSLRKYIPSSIKLRLQKLKRDSRDLVTRQVFQFAKKAPEEAIFPYFIEREQEIKPSATFEAKKLNLKKASALISQYELKPGQVLSFWKAVKNPTTKRGFAESRTIVNGELEPSVGGGLCQLSGLLYYISLEAQLNVVERHNHSKDIYTEETRFTPLGSDAAVVYGYKDLRIKNPFDFPIRFLFSFTENTVTIKLTSLKPISKTRVTFDRTDQVDGKIEVVSKTNGSPQETSKYIKPNHT